ncbi:MAG: hypothetical protein QM541_16940 [Flavobacterium sp.]|nr:hypothetical protein [Flavobacterium sp.]
MDNILGINEQISQNEKSLDFYYQNYKKTLEKFNVILLMYSPITVFLIQTIKFPIEKHSELGYWIYIYLVFLCVSFYFFIQSLRNSYLLFKPIDVAYLNLPKVFYKDIRLKYETELQTTDEAVINAYVKTTYLEELEKTVANNQQLFEVKSRYYYQAFTKALKALFPFVLCIGFVNLYPSSKDVNKTEIINYKEILNDIDSINQKKYFMENNKPAVTVAKPKQDVVVIKIDTSKIIKTEPKMIKENFSAQEKKK